MKLQCENINIKYGLLTKREVKIAGYWPSSFFACLWTETKGWIQFIVLTIVKRRNS